ncbi:MAG: FHA domain-containing protein [Pseudomonadota bacterium]
MSHLVVTTQDKLVGEYPITRERITIGRKPDNDVCINSLAISGYHTQIITVLNSSFLEDLNSTNGTFVNSQSVKKHALEDGDLIVIGDHQLRFVDENDNVHPKVPSDVLESTIVLTPDSQPTQKPANDGGSESNGKEQPSSIPSRPAPIIDTRERVVDEVPSPTAKVKERLGKLQVLNGKNAGLVLELNKSLTTFGSPKIAIAGITKRPNGYFLVHVQGGENCPTMLNGEELKNKANQLEDNDIIEVANIKLEFFVEVEYLTS